ncbi:MAG: hypothetical protein M1837_004100 [Sclerophora amabilis]|nr:MAG: hypothetical protein M1837_004100 [Sclerophora amabilis]
MSISQWARLLIGRGGLGGDSAWRVGKSCANQKWGTGHRRPHGSEVLGTVRYPVLGNVLPGNTSLLESLPQPPQISPAPSLSPVPVNAGPEFVLKWHSFFNKIPLVSMSDVVKANGEGFLFYFAARKDTQKASELADKRGLEPRLVKRMATISSNHHRKVDPISMEVDEFDDWAKVLRVVTNWLEKDKKKGVKVKIVS